jgi:hypothetical protein
MGQKISPKDNLRELVKRYSGGVRPASVTDAQTWLGLKLKDTFEASEARIANLSRRRAGELFDLARRVLT